MNNIVIDSITIVVYDMYLIDTSYDFYHRV